MSTKQIMLSLEEFEKDLQSQFNVGYATCLSHVKAVIDGQSLQIAEGTDEATANVWKTLIATFKKKEVTTNEKPS